MKTEKLKQIVKGYVHQFEDGGLRLLRKGQKGVIHAIFSRFGLVLVLLVWDSLVHLVLESLVRPVLDSLVHLVFDFLVRLQM